MRQRIKRKKYRERRRESKYQAKLLEENLKKKYAALKAKLDREREQELREAKTKAIQRREEKALSLEKKAEQIRKECIELADTDSDYLDICSDVEASAAGTFSFSTYSTSCNCSESSKCRKALNQAIYYRDIAEKLKTENRKLHVEFSEKVETVRNFWRNSFGRRFKWRKNGNVCN